MNTKIKGPNIKDVAIRAKVSATTVSCYLNRTAPVNKETSKRIEGAINELGYTPNYIARSLRKEKTYSIGIIVGNVLSEFYSIIAKSVEDTANKYGYNLILCNGDEDPEKELKYLKVLKSNRVDGIILTPTGQNGDFISWLINSKTNIVFLDRLIDGVDCDAVVINNEAGTHSAIKYLIKQGYRKIGIINGCIDRTTGKGRFDGYLRALKEAQIPIDEELIKFGDFKEASGYSLAKELIQGENKPEVIFVANIDMTLGALASIKELGLKIPDDIGVCGFDDPKWATIMDPPLTTVSQPTYKLGSTAAEMLLSKIDNKKSKTDNKPRIITLDTNFIIRDSTKNINSSFNNTGNIIKNLISEFIFL